MLLKNFWCGMMSLRGCVAVAAVSGLLLLAACDGDSGANAPSDNGTSDSEDILSSSSSPKVESSSSVILSGDCHEESSSSSSSSLKKVSSSSKLLSSSSSSEKAKSSSSSKDEAESSSSSQGSSSSEKNSDGRSWDVPKDAYLNPEITYESIVDSRDGQTYKTVKIGNQVWMAENLNYADSAKTPSLKGKSWCYDNNPESCAVAGRLYTWAAAIDSVKLANDQEHPRDCGYGKICTLPDTVYGICPDGWHLPTNAEWKTLFVEVGGCTLLEYSSYSSCPSAGKILKSQTGWRGDKGSDAYGFSAIQVGRRSAEGYFDYDETYFWSVVEDDGYKANYMAYGINLGYTYDFTGLDYHSKRSGGSVRCLKN